MPAAPSPPEPGDFPTPTRGWLLVTLLSLVLPDPPRRGIEASRQQPAHHGAVAYLRQHRDLFVPLLAGTSLLYLFSNAFSSWMPSLFVRTFAWEPAAIGLRLGALILIGALAGTLLSGAVATALVRRGRPEGGLLTVAGGAALLAPAALLGPLAPDALLAQAAVMLIYFAIALCFGVATASIVAVTPSSLRGRMVALYLLL